MNGYINYASTVPNNAFYTSDSGALLTSSGDYFLTDGESSGGGEVGVMTAQKIKVKIG